MVTETVDPPRSGTVRSKRRHHEQATAQVFARDRRLGPDAPLVFLAHGQADALREDARAGHLVCPLADCQDNRFVVHGGTERRHHFKHRHGAGGHAPETIAHHTAKHLIARWLRSFYPDAQVHADTKEVETGQRPDVLLVLEDGTHVAYEVQFAALTAETWQARHDRYTSGGIKDVWLFGGKTYDRPERSDQRPDDQIRLHPVFKAALAAHRPILLIDAFAETVGLGTGADVDRLLAAAGVEPPDLWDATVTISQRLPLMGIPAAKGVIEIPGVREQMQRARSAHAKWLEQLRREAEEEARARAEHQRRLAAFEEAERRERLRQEERARAQAQAQERAAEVQRRRQALLTAELQKRKAHWRPERERIEDRVGVLPKVVDSPGLPRETSTTTAAPDQWRWAVLEAVADHHGYALDPAGLEDLVPLAPGARQRDAEQLVKGYLNCLRAAGWVWFWGADGPRTGEAVVVLAGRGTPVPRPAPTSALRVVGARVAGPGPGGLAYLAEDGTPTMWPTARARRAGAAAVEAAITEAYDEDRERALRASLAGPAAAASATDGGRPAAPDLTAVHTALPEAARWCSNQEWPAWTALPARLHEAAKLTVYVLDKVYGGQTQAEVRLGTCSESDMQEIAEALRASGYITATANGWQVTWGGKL